MASKCCPNMSVQFYPDPNELEAFNLVCANCGTLWQPWTPQEIVPPAPPMAPFETQALSKLNAIMREFDIEGADPVVAGLVGAEGGSVHETAWNNLDAALMASNKKSWSKAALAKEMATALTEAQTVEVLSIPDQNLVNPNLLS